MPTRYKPIVTSPARDEGDDFQKIAAEIEKRRDQLLGIMKRECSRFDEDMIEVEFDWLNAVLCKFALSCAAMPLRTPRMLMATVAVAERFPADFLRCTDLFDPEAVARVVGTCGARSDANETALSLHEIGEGDGPPPEEIRAAAVEVLARLRQDIANGGTKRRPKVELQYDLAISLGRRFVAMGGRLTRVTFDGETGPFHRLLEIVLVPTATRLAKEAGFALTIRSMVRIAREDLRAGNTLAP